MVGGGEHGEAAGERHLPPHHLQVLLAAAHLDSGNQAFIAKFVWEAIHKIAFFGKKLSVKMLYAEYLPVYLKPSRCSAVSQAILSGWSSSPPEHNTIQKQALATYRVSFLTEVLINSLSTNSHVN